MKNQLLRLFEILIILPIIVFAQQKEEPRKDEPKKDEQKFGITLSGFIKNDIMLDSRQTYSFREGHFLLYPSAEVKDKYGDDINAKANFNILSIQTRLNAKITGPEAFGAKTSGMIEGEFFGTADADINGFRLRHAYAKLDWESTSLMIGQFWHPMFVTDCFPAVVSFNTGAPFQPFVRAPQIRLTKSFGNVNLIAAIAAQRDFPSNGPNGFTSTYMRNAVVPNVHLQFQLKSGGSLFGVAGDFKSLTPRLVTTKNVKTDESISSIACLGYMKLDLSPITFKLEGVFGQNLSDMLMLGGYAVKSMDTLTAKETYTNVKCFSMWGELSSGKEIEAGIFFGYTKNLGADDNVVGSYYLSRLDASYTGKFFDNIFRVAPRIQFNSGKTRISAEVEYTSAAYGTPNNNNKGKVENTTTIANLRVLLAVYYFF